MAATGDDVDAFLARAEPVERREDALRIAALIGRITGEAPQMWGSAIVGYGRYHYRYDSGREGDMCRIGFSPRKPHLVLYLPGTIDGYGALLHRLGRHTRAKACLYIKRFADVDETVLAQVIEQAWSRGTG
jgi:hypothetical protein